MDKKAEKNALMDIFYRRSKDHGLKITPQRVAIYQELLKRKDHPSADVIYKRILKKIPNISFDTVNRTLLTFSRIGITNIVEGYGQSKRYDPDITLHHYKKVLFANTARAIGSAPIEIQIRHIGNCLKADPAYGKGEAKALGIPLSEVPK